MKPLLGNDEALSVLWANQAETRYLVAGIYELGLWSREGKEFWTWKVPQGRRLRSARFEDDGSITVAA